MNPYREYLDLPRKEIDTENTEESLQNKEWMLKFCIFCGEINCKKNNRRTQIHDGIPYTTLLDW